MGGIFCNYLMGCKACLRSGCYIPTCPRREKSVHSAVEVDGKDHFCYCIFVVMMPRFWLQCWFFFPQFFSILPILGCCFVASAGTCNLEGSTIFAPRLCKREFGQPVHMAGRHQVDVEVPLDCSYSLY